MESDGAAEEAAHIVRCSEKLISIKHKDVRASIAILVSSFVLLGLSMYAWSLPFVIVVSFCVIGFGAVTPLFLRLVEDEQDIHRLKAADIEELPKLMDKILKRYGA